MVGRTVFKVKLVDDFITVATLGDDAQPDVGELGAGNAASGVVIINSWDEVPKDDGGARRASEEGWRVRRA